MKKIISLLLVLVLTLGLFAACGGNTPDDGTTAPASTDATDAPNPAEGGFPEGAEIAIPNDTTNEARALNILANLGLIKLADTAGITATVLDIVENPYNISFKEVEAAQLPNVLQDVDYAVINSNYAIEAGLKPSEALALEGAYSAYSNIIAVKEGNEDADLTKALVAAMKSRVVGEYIAETYGGDILSVVEEFTDGYDPDLDYDALAGQTITIAASPTPHAEILAVAKDILAAKDINLEVTEYTDYVVPNQVVDSGEVYANYFQHLPYLEDFNAENGTHIVSVASIHVEPMGVYGGKQTTLNVGK